MLLLEVQQQIMRSARSVTHVTVNLIGARKCGAAAHLFALQCTQYSLHAELHRHKNNENLALFHRSGEFALAILLACLSCIVRFWH